MPLIDCEINLTITWSQNCVISKVASNQAATFAITDTKLHFPDKTSTDDNGKLLQHLKSGFKQTINWIKYQSKTDSKQIFRLLN